MLQLKHIKKEYTDDIITNFLEEQISLEMGQNKHQHASSTTQKQLTKSFYEKNTSGLTLDEAQEILFEDL